MTAYHFGHVLLSNQAQYDSDGTVAVGSFPANVFGLHDMHGNVWEWVDDCWHDDYTGAPTNGSAWLSGCRDVNFRVLRGGSWNFLPGNLRSAFRDGNNATGQYDDGGFRVAWTLTP